MVLSVADFASVYAALVWVFFRTGKLLLCGWFFFRTVLVCMYAADKVMESGSVHIDSVKADPEKPFPRLGVGILNFSADSRYFVRVNSSSLLQNETWNHRNSACMRQTVRFD